MYASTAITAFLVGSAIAVPTTTLLLPRQDACFIIGSDELPESVVDSVTAVQDSITCDDDTTTLSGVPDVTSGDVSFSSIDFSQSDLTPLEFALTEFAAEDPLADTDLEFFENSLNVYLATEAGIRSVSGDLTIKIPKFFLEFQVSRIQTAQGNPPTEAGLQVDHLLEKVTKNAAGEDQSLLDEVIALASQLE